MYIYTVSYYRWYNRQFHVPYKKLRDVVLWHFFLRRFVLKVIDENHCHLFSMRSVFTRSFFVSQWLDEDKKIRRCFYQSSSKGSILKKSFNKRNCLVFHKEYVQCFIGDTPWTPCIRTYTGYPRVILPTILNAFLMKNLTILSFTIFILGSFLFNFFQLFRKWSILERNVN